MKKEITENATNESRRRFLKNAGVAAATAPAAALLLSAKANAQAAPYGTTCPPGTFLNANGDCQPIP